SEEVIALDDGTDPVTGKFLRKRDYFDQLFDDDDDDRERDNELPKSLP
nr:probable methyltransferase PMT9 [Tanacetum cinerariifolium]